ncbi:terminase small subunit [Polaromonas sp.]|uniref:terminase small subunit n=1 Tax=Polaromonas sp. TaxID=1869339 RepID=UPI0018226E78|nr:terminase small subunit [Polaromonas sp.]NMM07409.1 terminase small subunit [Polaromonas sp.]
MELKGKQADFVREYLVDLNATQAAIRAGYSPKTARSIANENLTKPDIQAAIERERQKLAERTELSQDEVIRGIRETISRCNQAEAVCDASGKPVMVTTPAGDLAPAYRFEPMAVLRGWELLGKHLGMFTNRHEVTGKLSGQQYGVLVVPAGQTVEEWERETLALNDLGIG